MLPCALKPPLPSEQAYARTKAPCLVSACAVTAVTRRALACTWPEQLPIFARSGMHPQVTIHMCATSISSFGCTYVFDLLPTGVVASPGACALARQLLMLHCFVATYPIPCPTLICMGTATHKEICRCASSLPSTCHVSGFSTTPPCPPVQDTHLGVPLPCSHCAQL
jgi:hypothetical protein